MPYKGDWWLTSILTGSLVWWGGSELLLDGQIEKWAGLERKNFWRVVNHANDRELKSLELMLL